MGRVLKNFNQEPIDIEVVRYFVNNDMEYLIYSLNEVDDSGYTKLYASKIVGNQARIITDDEEWILIKELIKDIVRNNRDGNELNIIDLDENNLNDIVLTDTRVFKLQGNLVTLLGENKRVKKTVEEESEDLEDSLIDDIEEDIDYEGLYRNQLERNQQLEEKIENLEKSLEEYKLTIEKIKDLIEE